jgi:GNAT superfamily N-acetyltransferase
LTADGDLEPGTALPHGIEWRRGEYKVSTDPARLDQAGIAEFLASSYWAPEIPESVVRRAVEGSLVFGLYDGDRQIGFARVVTDRATFAWVCDVFVRESHRGQGLGRWLMRCVLAHPELRELRRWMLASTTARGLYAQLGFNALANPERLMEIVDMDVHRRQRQRETEGAGDGTTG